MTAALLRNQLFHHLLATNPETSGRDNARAGALSLAFHGAIALLLLQLPTADRLAEVPTVTTPILLEHITVQDYTPAAAQPSGSRGGVVGPMPLVQPSVLPVDVPAPTLPGRSIVNDLKEMVTNPTALPGGREIGPGRQGGSTGGGDFIVLQNAPRMLNATHIAALLRREYPPRLMQAGIGGTVVLQVLIDLNGQVTDARIVRDSGLGELDNAALRVSREMLFSPAQNREHAVRVWAEIPIVFSTRN